jgi:hypothetical protein
MEIIEHSPEGYIKTINVPSLDYQRDYVQQAEFIKRATG